MLFGTAKYSEWLPTSAYGDTGERCGFVRSILSNGGGGGSDSLEDDIVGGDDGWDVDENNAGEAVPLPDLTLSAATLANMQGVQVPHMPVGSAAERAKFDGMFLRFVMEDGGQSLLDFDRFALEWNTAVSDMEEGKSAVSPIFRKTAGHLKAHWKR